MTEFKGISERERNRIRRKIARKSSLDDPLFEQVIASYDERARVKRQLIIEQGMSNSAAEHFLDREGYPRPIGLGAVFFYPGSTRLRDRYLYGALGLAAAAIALTLWWI